MSAVFVVRFFDDVCTDDDQPEEVIVGDGGILFATADAWGPGVWSHDDVTVFAADEGDAITKAKAERLQRHEDADALCMFRVAKEAELLVFLYERLDEAWDAPNDDEDIADGFFIRPSKLDDWFDAMPDMLVRRALTGFPNWLRSRYAATSSDITEERARTWEEQIRTVTNTLLGLHYSGRTWVDIASGQVQ